MTTTDFSPLRGPEWPAHVRFALLVVLLAFCALGGGASRPDVLSMALVKPAAILLGAFSLLLPGPFRWRELRTPLLLLVALAAVIAIQLVPLPPTLWAWLPGHAQLMPVTDLAGQVWRPISLAPDLTIASLTALSVPVAALLLLAGISVERSWRLLPYLIGLVVLSALFGAGQIAGGPDSPFYLYRVTNTVSAVGLLANRNHQALLLALGIPMLAVWASFGREKQDRNAWQRWMIAGTMSVLLLPILAVTGSRGGLIAAPVGLLIFWLLFRDWMGGTRSVR
ncbi:MAG: O-antigen polymerase, partial [Oxalobacteraceae bacterium]